MCIHRMLWEMVYDKKLHLWRCPDCEYVEKGEEPLEPEKDHRYGIGTVKAITPLKMGEQEQRNLLCLR